MHIRMTGHITRAGDPLLRISERVMSLGHAPVDRRPVLSNCPCFFCGAAEDSVDDTAGERAADDQAGPDQRLLHLGGGGAGGAGGAGVRAEVELERARAALLLVVVDGLAGLAGAVARALRGVVRGNAPDGSDWLTGSSIA